jgi:putative peptidoglycan lipid II flippase
MMGAFIVSRLLGLVREIVLAQQFGTNAEFGAYQAAFRVPDFLFNVIGAGAIGSAFIPVFAGYLARDDEEDAWRFASAIMNLLTVAMLVGAATAAVLAPQITRTLIVPGFAEAEQALTAELVRVMLLSPILFAVSGLLTAILNSQQQFFLPSLSLIVYNLSIIFGAVVLAPTGLGVRGLTAGVVLGSALHLAVQLPGLWRMGGGYTFTLGLAEEGVRRVATLLGPRVLGMAAVQLNFIVNVNLASRLADGPARVTALNYAWLLMMLPEGIFALSIANAVFPTFSAQVARGNQDEMRSTLAGILRLILFVTIPASVGLFMLGTPLVQVLFQRGEFTSESTRLTVSALQFYALGLFAHSTVEIVTRAFYALHDTMTPVALGAAAMLMNIALSLVLVGPLQHGGLALANTVATTLEMLLLVELLRRRLGNFDDGLLLSSLGKTVGATALMAVALAGLLLALPALPSVVVSVLGIGLGAGVYVGAAAVLRAPELQFVVRMVDRVRARFLPARPNA